jgi:hypothetical protein
MRRAIARKKGRTQRRFENATPREVHPDAPNRLRISVY